MSVRKLPVPLDELEEMELACVEMRKSLDLLGENLGDVSWARDPWEQLKLALQTHHEGIQMILRRVEKKDGTFRLLKDRRPKPNYLRLLKDQD